MVSHPLPQPLEILHWQRLFPFCKLDTLQITLADVEIATFRYDINMPAFENLPSFLAKKGYLNPTDPNSTNWHDMKGPHSQGMFAEMARTPTLTSIFQKVMNVYTDSKFPWVDLYPTETLVADAMPHRAVVVDVGGGEGTDINKLRRKHSELANGSLVLQDQALVIEHCSPHPDIKTMAHDFFTSPCIMGACKHSK